MNRQATQKTVLPDNLEAEAQPQEYDSPWKEMLSLFFRDFVTFFFHDLDTAIDWSRGFEFLDKELQKITVKSKLGRRLADKLVKVFLLDGREVWVLVHIEVQGKRERRFAERMFVYHYRIFDSFGQKVISMAILTDDDTRWRPSEYGYDLFETGIRLKFRSVKLMDYAKDWALLEKSANPFAVVVMAHLKAMETKNKPLHRFRWKLELLKGLYQRGHDAEFRRQLIRFIDWVMMLPVELENKLEYEITQFEEEEKMEYVTSFERIATRRGLEKGLKQGLERGASAVILRQLRWQFGELKPTVEKRIAALPFETLEQLSETVFVLASQTELSKWLREHAPKSKKTKKREANS